MHLNGVRAVGSSKGIDQGIKGWECPMPLSLKDSVHLVADPANLDASVDEVFRLMLGVNCVRQAKPIPSPGADKESLTAVIGFGGRLSGACVFRCSAQTAMKVAGHMTGMEFSEVEDTVKDESANSATCWLAPERARFPSSLRTAGSRFRQSLRGAITICTCSHRNSSCIIRIPSTAHRLK